MDATEVDRARRARGLLLLGAAAGIVLAAVSLLQTGPGAAGLPDSAIARVGDTLLLRADYQRALAALAADRREPLGAEEERHVLDRMIEEELLLQHGLELDLIRRDRFTRGALVNAVIAVIAGHADQEAAGDDALRAFHAESADYFVSPGRVRVRQVFLRVPTGSDPEPVAARARAAAARLRAGDALAAVQTELGDPIPVPIPDAPLPPVKLREYLGPTPVRSALELAPGEVSDPVRSTLGFHVLWMVERQPPRTPAFEEIEAQVRNEFRRRQGDRALREALDRLRARGDVVLAPDGP